MERFCKEGCILAKNQVIVVLEGKKKTNDLVCHGSRKKFVLCKSPLAQLNSSVFKKFETRSNLNLFSPLITEIFIVNKKNQSGNFQSRLNVIMFYLCSFKLKECVFLK